MIRLTAYLLIAGSVIFGLPGELCAEEAADMFECADCHPMRIRDFKGRRSNPITPVEEYPELLTGTQNVASSAAMCFSCHDGFVEDSREVWEEGVSHSHRLGMVPSSRIAVPNIGSDPAFPMNEDGNMHCGTCHSAHLSSADDAPENVKPFMRAASNGDLCRGCHVDESSIVSSAHDRGRRRNSDFESRGTCGSCHAAHSTADMVMWARDRGDADLPLDRLCRSCHDDEPDPGEHPIDIVAWSQDLRASSRGASIAAMPVFDADGRHATVGNIACATCHNPHRERAEGRPENLPGLFLRAPELVQPLCADCHGPDSLFLYKFFHSPRSR